MDVIITLILWGGIICLAIFLFQAFLAVLFSVIGLSLAGIFAIFDKLRRR